MAVELLLPLKMKADDGKRAKTSGISDAFIDNAEFLRRYVRQFVPSFDEAEDVAQEAFLRAFVAEKKTHIRQPRAFLFQVARNVALTRLARKSRQIQQCIDELSELDTRLVDAAADDHAEALELLENYSAAVVALPPKCRDVFLLRKVYGLKHKEIAQQMGLSISSVEKYVRRGILACQDHLARRYEPAVRRRRDDTSSDLRRKVAK